jgi:putative tricarboxylic transport membrane protein
VTIDRVGGVALAVIAIVWMWQASKLPLGSLQNPGPAYVPMLLAALLFVFGVLVLLTGGRARRMAEVGWAEWRHAVAILAVLGFMAFALERLGYRITVVVALVVLLLGLERRSWLTAAIFSVVFAAASFHLFAVVLRVPLPRSPWGF